MLSSATRLGACGKDDANAAVRATREALAQVAPDLAPEVSGPAGEIFAGPFALVSTAGVTALSLGALTLALAMVGLYGVQSHLAAARVDPNVALRYE